MQDDLLFRVIVMGLFVGARYVRWHARHRISWQASWPSMKRHPLDTSVLIVLSLCWLTAVVIYMVVPQLVSAFTAPIPTWLRWCAAAAAVAGLALLWWSDRCLGENLSVTLRIRQDHTLVSRGPYSKVRHPIYSATSDLRGGARNDHGQLCPGRHDLRPDDHLGGSAAGTRGEDDDRPVRGRLPVVHAAHREALSAMAIVAKSMCATGRGGGMRRALSICSAVSIVQISRGL